MKCASCNLRWPSLQKVKVDFQGLQAQLTGLTQQLWRNNTAYQQLQQQWQQSRLRETETGSKLAEAKEALQEQEKSFAVQTLELEVTKDSLNHEFRLQAGSEETIALQRDTIQKLVTCLNKLVSPDDLTIQYGILLPDEFGLGTMLKENQDLKYLRGSFEQQLQLKELDILRLQQEKQEAEAKHQRDESEIGALRQELLQYCSEEEVEFGTAVLGKRRRTE